MAERGRIRESRFELLRLIAIFLIVLHHLALHTAIDNLPGITINRAITQLYLIGGKLGVNCFVFITGYFGILNRFRSEKILKVEIEVLFYTIICFIISFVFLGDAISFRSIAGSVFPTIFRTYWFVTGYVGMVLLSPYINIMANKISRKQYIALLITMCGMFSFVPTFLRQWNWCSELFWFVFLYLIGGFIRLNEEELKDKGLKWWLGGTVFTFCLIWMISVVLMFLALKWDRLNSYVNVFSLSTYSMPILVCGFCLFMTFVSIKPFYNKVMNQLANYVLGVYLIQSNPFVSSRILWPWIEQWELYKKNFWILWALLITIFIIAGCMLIDAIRFQLFKGIKIKKVEKICRWIDLFLNEG